MKGWPSHTLTLAVILSCVQPTWLNAAPLSKRIASYQIDATLDVVKKTVTGKAQIDWTNSSSHLVNEIRLHLYMNAFSGHETTFARESTLVTEGFTGWGSINVTSLRCGEKMLALEAFSPDDHNSADRTVARVALPEPVAPGTTIRLEAEFITQLPRCLDRTGYVGNFFMLAQWYPKIGVLEEDGSWNCHQMHADSEFFADFGNYDVTLRLPAKFTIVATGIQVSKEVENSTQVVKYHAEDVTDFAAAAQPGIPVLRRAWKSPLGHEVTLLLFMQPEHLGSAERHVRAMQEALAFLEDWSAPYPYSVLTLVDPPWSAVSSAGAMEYPLLFTTATKLLEPAACVTEIEGTTVHETIHQYLQHILASNEAEEPWLDEGLNSYLTGKILDTRFGASVPSVTFMRLPLGWFLKLPALDTWQQEKVHWLEDPDSDSATRKSWEFRSSESYFRQVYDRTHLVLRGVENELGEAKMREVFRRYYARFAFRHPRGKDFQAIVSEVAGHEMGPYFEVLLGKAEGPDFAIEEVDPHSGGTRLTRLTVERRTPVTFPVDILVHFDDGSSSRLRWAGDYRYATFDLPKTVTSAEIDPRHKILLDKDDLNNSWTARPERGFAWKWANACAALIQLLFVP